MARCSSIPNSLWRTRRSSWMPEAAMSAEFGKDANHRQQTVETPIATDERSVPRPKCPARLPKGKCHDFGTVDSDVHLGACRLKPYRDRLRDHRALWHGPCHETRRLDRPLPRHHGVDERHCVFLSLRELRPGPRGRSLIAGGVDG